MGGCNLSTNSSIAHARRPCSNVCSCSEDISTQSWSGEVQCFQEDGMVVDQDSFLLVLAQYVLFRAPPLPRPQARFYPHRCEGCSRNKPHPEGTHVITCVNGSKNNKTVIAFAVSMQLELEVSYFMALLQGNILTQFLNFRM